MSGTFTGDFSTASQVTRLKRTTEIQEVEILKRAKLEDPNQTIIANIVIPPSGSIVVPTGTLDLADNSVTLAKIQNATASSRLLGSGVTGGGLPYSELTLGAGLTMTGTMVSVTGSATSPSNGQLLIGNGTSSLTPAFLTSTGGTISFTPGVGSLNIEASSSVVTSTFKNPVRVATTGSNITLNGTQTIDGVSLLSSDRVLVKDQILGETNGIYVVGVGVWTRSQDADTSVEVLSGMTCKVTEGNVNADQTFVLTTLNPIVLNTTPLVFSSAIITNELQINAVGATNTTTISSVSPAASRTYTIQDAGAAANVAMVPSPYVVGDIPYANSTTTLAKLADVATGSVLVSGGVGVAPSYSTTPTFTATNVTGLPIVNGTTGTLTETRGGTNQTTYTTGDLLYASAANTLSKLTDVAIGSVLASGGIGVAPAYTSTPVLSSETLSATSNQLVLGTTNTTTINSVVPSTSRVYTIQDAGATANVAVVPSPYVVGDIPYANSTTTLAKLADVATGSVLVSGGVGIAPSWSPVTSTQLDSNAVTTTKITDSNVTLAKLQNASASSKILGSGSSGSGSAYSELSIGSGLSITLTTLDTTGGAVVPGGSNTQIQYNNAGAFGGASALTYNSGTNTTTAEKLVVSATTNQVVLGTTNTTTLTSVAPAAPRTYTIQDAGSAANVAVIPSPFVTGDIPYASSTTQLSKLADVAVGSVLRSGGIGAAPSWTTTPSVTSQTLTATSNQITIGAPTNTVVINAVAPVGTNQAYSLQDAGAAANIALIQNPYTKGDVYCADNATQLAAISAVTVGSVFVSNGTSANPVWSATPTLSSETLSATTNQLVLGTANTTTINSVAPSAPRIYTIQDAGAAANVAIVPSPYVVGDITYADSTTTLAKLPIGTTSQRLFGGVTPNWKTMTVNRQVITTTSTYTATIGSIFCFAQCWGGGGAGGGAPSGGAGSASVGGGGGSGAYAAAWFLSSSITGATTTIGSGGTGSAGLNGSNGNTTSLGTNLIANGGFGGIAMTAASSEFRTIAGGLGGTTSAQGIGNLGTILNFQGGSGQPGISLRRTGSALSLGGMGGIPYNGFNTGTACVSDEVSPASLAGVSALAYGGGGSGAATATTSGTTTAVAGGNGANGVVYIDEFF